MAYEINDLIIGKVVNVKPYAAFLKFEDGSTGLLHISEISDSFIKDIESFTSVDDQIKVKVIEVDPKNGFLRVSLKKVPHGEHFSTHSNSKKTSIKIVEDDFLPLKEKLQEWIDETLELAKTENK